MLSVTLLCNPSFGATTERTGYPLTVLVLPVGCSHVRGWYVHGNGPVCFGVVYWQQLRYALKVSKWANVARVVPARRTRPVSQTSLSCLKYVNPS